jgi:predicted anti-sigma-YlaC factor YlaD
MRCYSIRKKLTCYADGEGKASEREAISMHLDICPICRNELNELQTLNVLLNKSELPDVPPHLHEKIMYEIKNKAQKRQAHKGLRWNLIPVTASLVISLYFGIFLGTKTMPLTVAKMEISSLDFGQQTLNTDDDSQENSNE